MLHKCANPACLTAFRSLGDGKLFQIERQQVPGPGKSPGRRRLKSTQRVERYWLCAECAASFTIAPQDLGGVAAIPLRALSLRAFPETHV